MKILIVLLAMLLLGGCASQPVFEGVQDVYAPAPVQPKEVKLQLPSAQMIQSDAGTLYLCEGFEVTVQIFPAGDLDGTIEAISGFADGQLTVMATSTADIWRYECAWAAAGEGGDAIARAAVLDDGQYHYCVTVMGPSENAVAMADQWQKILNSASVS